MKSKTKKQISPYSGNAITHETKVEEIIFLERYESFLFVPDFTSPSDEISKRNSISDDTRNTFRILKSYRSSSENWFG